MEYYSVKDFINDVLTPFIKAQNKRISTINTYILLDYLFY